MDMEISKTKRLPNVTSIFKIKVFIFFCIFMHSLIACFAFIYNIQPLVFFNLGSILVYLICRFIVNKFQSMVLYIGFIEIIFHSFVSVILIGNNFGFSMYFIALVPMTFNLLHATNSRRYLLKAILLSIITFIMYATCYIISNKQEPVYYSDALNSIMPHVYVINMLVTFMALSIFSVLFLLETEGAYKHLYSKNEELGNLANRDPLTGLYNRRTMTDHIAEMYLDSKLSSTPFSLIICDIDDFKQFNDTYGHECGDEILKTVSNILTSLTRGHDFLCRWGGEEFLVILKNIDLELARTIAERIRVQIMRKKMDYNNCKVCITMTFGVASSCEADNYEELFKLADDRLYEGKHSGKNIVV